MGRIKTKEMHEKKENNLDGDYRYDARHYTKEEVVD